MNAGELYKAGRLAEAIEAQVQEVKASPLDQSKRLFLFELLAFSGELDRARRQVEALNYTDNDLERAAVNYRKLLDSEQARRDLFARGVAPGFFGEPAEHLRLRLAAVNCLQRRQAGGGRGTHRPRRTRRLLPSNGQLNGRPFEVLRDADDLLSGVLEVMAQGRYFWAGLEQVRLVATNPPRFPRDLLYLPARLELATEAGEVFLPALYPGSHQHADDQVKLGRMTDWKDLGDGLTQGLGLHTYLVDEDAISLLEWREFRLPE